MDKTKALDKIVKLINLSKSSNEHEAAAALRQSKALMDRFEVSDSDLESVGMTHRALEGKNYKRHDDMEYQVITIVANVFHVSVVLVRGSKAKGLKSLWVLFGRKSRVQVVEYFFGVLMGILAQKRKEFLRTLRGKGYTRPQKASLTTAFLYGWLNGVAENIHIIAFPDSEQALIKRYSDRVMGGAETEALRGKESVTIKHVSRLECLNAFAQGKEKGQTVQLHHGVANSPTDPEAFLAAPPLLLAAQ